MEDEPTAGDETNPRSGGRLARGICSDGTGAARDRDDRCGEFESGAAVGRERFEPVRGVRGGRFECEVGTQEERCRCFVAARGLRLAQQRQSQPQRDVIAEALDECDLLEVEVRFP